MSIFKQSKQSKQFEQFEQFELRYVDEERIQSISAKYGMDPEEYTKTYICGKMKDGKNEKKGMEKKEKYEKLLKDIQEGKVQGHSSILAMKKRDILARLAQMKLSEEKRVDNQKYWDNYFIGTSSSEKFT